MHPHSETNRFYTFTLILPHLLAFRDVDGLVGRGAEHADLPHRGQHFRGQQGEHGQPAEVHHASCKVCLLLPEEDEDDEDGNDDDDDEGGASRRKRRIVRADAVVNKDKDQCDLWVKQYMSETLHLALCLRPPYKICSVWLGTSVRGNFVNRIVRSSLRIQNNTLKRKKSFVLPSALSALNFLFFFSRFTTGDAEHGIFVFLLHYFAFFVAETVQR